MKTIIAIEKDNKIFYGSLKQISKIIRVHVATIGRWWKEREKNPVKFENGYKVFLDANKLES
jgi:hypothetical protein